MRDPELRALKPAERQFVDCMARQGLDKVEAYALAYDVQITDDNRTNIRNKAHRLFYLPHVYNYYNELVKEMNDKETGKALWTRDVATKKLLNLIEHAEDEVYNQKKQLTMGRITAILMPAKELNLMHGFNQTNVNVEGCVVQIGGEEDLED
jgi:hypothetical protein